MGACVVGLSIYKCVVVYVGAWKGLGLTAIHFVVFVGILDDTIGCSCCSRCI